MDRSQAVASQLRDWTGIQSPIFLLAVLSSAVLAALILRSRAPKQPPWLPETIPFVSNTYDFVINQKRFLERSGRLLEKNSIIRFNLGTVPVYLIVGARNIQTLFKPSTKIGSEALMTEIIFPMIIGMPKHEVDRFKGDVTGRAKNPNPGTESTPAEQRLWHANHHIYTEYLARTKSTNRLTEIYHKNLVGKLDSHPVGEWVTLGLVDFCRNQMGKAATEALFGPKIFELNPDLLEAFWDFEAAVGPLFRGVPSWWNPKPYRDRERYFGMVENYLAAAFANFDWSKRGELDWDPHFGAAVLREIAKWLKDEGFADRTAAASIAQFVFAANANTIPITSWCLMEAVHDPKLFKDLREEVQQAVVVDPETGKTSVDVAKLVALPLLQSVYVETLRMHMSFNIVRAVNEPIAMDGYEIGKGSQIQAPMQLAHLDEAVWGVPEHPASEFWAERHVKYVESKDEKGGTVWKREFVMAGRPSSFFPYGGGQPVCPGRHFSKQEIMLTLGLIIAKFNVEFVEWTKMDGSPSDRPAQDNADYVGAEAMPPDRDMKVRWKKLW